MTGTLRAAMVLVAVLGMNLVGCGGGGGEAGSPEGSPVARSSEEDLDGPMAVEGPPSVAGTWVGEQASDGGGVTVMLDFEQDGGEALSGYGTVAVRGEEHPDYLTDLAGRVGDSGEVSFAEELGEESTYEPVSFHAEVAGSETMKLWPPDQSEGEPMNLERARTDLPEGMATAAVQSVYSRDWVWFSEHASDDVEDRLENDFEDEVDPDNPYDAFAQMVARQYDDEMAYADEEDEPPMGARVTLDEGSVVTREIDSSRVTVEFDYTTSDGRGGDADVSLERAGTAGSGFAYQIDDFRMEYEAGTGATYDMSMTY